MSKELESEIKLRYKIGSVVAGIVKHHAPFGVFIDLGHSEFIGIIEIINFSDDGIADVKDYPPIGSKVKTVVLGYHFDDSKQIGLSLKPSLIKQAENSN